MSSSTYVKNVVSVALAVKECVWHNAGLGRTCGWSEGERGENIHRYMTGTWKHKCMTLHSSTGDAALLDYTFQQNVMFPSASTLGTICTHPLVWDPV